MSDSARMRLTLRASLTLGAVFAVALALLAVLLLHRPGAWTAEEAARRYLVAAASGNRFAAYRVNEAGIGEAFEGRLVLHPQETLLARVRQVFFGREVPFDARDLDLRAMPSPENREGGSRGFAVESYTDGSGSRTSAPSGASEEPAILRVSRKGDRWFVSGY